MDETYGTKDTDTADGGSGEGPGERRPEGVRPSEPGPGPTGTQPAGVFEPIGVDRIADAVVEQIEELILAGVLRSGQRLPSERELSETLDVSRPKLREAIRILEARGLVQVRRGEGAFVAPLVGEVLSPALMALCARHRGAFFDALEFRRQQEAFAARLAAERAAPADHEAITRAAAAMEALPEAAAVPTWVERDFAFHLAVGAAAHNLMLLHVLRAIYRLIGDGRVYDHRRLYARVETRRALMAQHQEIAGAIRSGDGERAAQASEAHLDFVERTCRTAEDEARRRRIAEKRLRLDGQAP